MPITQRALAYRQRTILCQQPRCHHSRSACHTSLQSPSPTNKLTDLACSTRAFRIFQQASAVCLSSLQILTSTLAPLPAQAVLNSPNAQIPRTADAALRRSIPAFNTNVRDMQQSMEDIAFLLRIPQRKPWGSMAKNVKDAVSMVQNRPRMLEGVPVASVAQAETLLDSMYSSLKKLELAIAGQQPDMVSIQVAAVLRDVASLELLQAPGLSFALPRDYVNLPRLTGRATISLEVAKAGGALAFVDKVNGGLQGTTTVELTLDGYSAPISAGNFVVNVMQGLYNNVSLASSYSSIIVQPKVETEKPPIPVEILPAGEFEPVYRSSLDVQQGELPVLPLSIYGAVSMARPPAGSESYLSGQDWFIFKYDKQQAGLAGLAFDEGTFGVFGYITRGADALESLQTGDVIVKATVTSGLDKLVLPQAPAL